MVQTGSGRGLKVSTWTAVQLCTLKNRLGVSKILNVKIPKYKTNKIDFKMTKNNIKALVRTCTFNIMSYIFRFTDHFL